MYEKQDAWLRAAYKELLPYVEQACGRRLPPDVKVLVQEPEGGSWDFAGKISGQAHKILPLIWISPWTMTGEVPEMDTAEVLAVLVHEMVHKGLPASEEHGRRFAAACFRLGLEGPPEATSAGWAFREFAEQLVNKIGPMPKISSQRQVEPAEDLWPSLNPFFWMMA